MKREPIIALDFPSRQTTLDFLKLFETEDHKPFVKIGMELFYAEGPEIITEIKKRGHKIFLDLKMHDIPNTVESAMRVLANLDVDIVNVHAAGGRKMMERALKGLVRKDGTRPLLIAVTQLTSTSPDMLREELLIQKTMEETVLRYAENSVEAGLDGVVCSPHEVKDIKRTCGTGFITITPGIRFSDSSTNDQVRVTTPKMAFDLGADFIVVGRPITRSTNPVEAYNKCLPVFSE